MAQLTPRQRRRERKRQNRIARRIREADRREAEFWRSPYGRMKRLVIAALLLPALLLLAVAAGPGAAVQGANALQVNMWAGYRPHAKQVQFHKSKARFKVLLAGRRSGKTYAAAREFIRRILQDYERAIAAGRRWEPGERDETGEPKPFLHYWAVAPTHPIGKVQRREVFDVLKGKRLIAHYKRSTGDLWLHGGILIEFKSADKPDSLVGAGLNGMWVDEAARLKADAWSGNLRPTLSDKRGWALFSTTPLGRNWFDDEIVRRADPDDEIHHRDYELFHFTSLDNPHLDPDEIETARREMPPRYFAREYLASRDSFQGQIYEEFNRQTHVIPLRQAPFYDRDPAAMARKARGFFDYFVAGKDWGFSEGHSGVTLIFGVRKVRREKKVELEYWAIAEIYEHTWLDDQWLEADKALQALWKPRTWWADPSRTDLVRKWRRKGFNIKGAKNDVLPGIAEVARYMHYERDANGQLTRAPRFFVLERPAGQSRTDYRGCSKLITELLGYVWATKADGSPLAEEQPVKRDDHTCDTCRYIIYSEAQSMGVGAVSKHPAW